MKKKKKKKLLLSEVNCFFPECTSTRNCNHDGWSGFLCVKDKCRCPKGKWQKHKTCVPRPGKKNVSDNIASILYGQPLQSDGPEFKSSTVLLSELVLPRISMFPEARETLRFSGNKINCFPRDQSLSDFLHLPSQK